MRAAFVVAASVLAASAHAQRQQTIQDALGNSVVIQTTTDADGDPATTTLRTAYTYPGAAGAGGAALPADELTSTTNTRVHTTTLWDDNGDPIVTTWTGTSTPRLPTTTSTTKAAVVTTTPDAETTTEAAAGGAAKQPQGGNKGIQGPPTTTYPPMTATTYGYKNQAGDWVTTQWTQSYTAPTEATAAVSSGSIQGLQEYKDSQKGMTDKAVQPGSVKASGASGRVASGAVVALVAGVLSYIL